MEWLSVLPPLVAIIVVLWRKEVISALLLAILTSELLQLTKPGLMSPVDGILNTMERIVSVFSSSGNTRILLFSLIIGALLALMRESGGVTALVKKLINKGIAKSGRQVGSVTFLTGVVIFIESNLSVLTAGLLSRDLFDKFKMSRARLAYIIDSTCAPICILILLNGWGAYVLGLLQNYDLPQSPVSVLWGTIPLNFYPILTLLLVMYTIWTGKVFGPMKDAEVKQVSHKPVEEPIKATKARFMLVPLCVLILTMFGFMYMTGDGDIAQGSGSKSVLYATTIAALVAYLMLLFSNVFSNQKLISIGFKGMGELLPLVTIVLLSLALGASLKPLGTGVFIAGLVGEYLPYFLIAPMLFIAGALMSFTTGTSWGTFAILIPIGVPLIQTLGLPPSLIIAAILGGGIFGDHCSPISDTTAVSSLASGCDLLEHVKTQLPYALSCGVVTVILYLAASFVMI